MLRHKLLKLKDLFIN